MACVEFLNPADINVNSARISKHLHGQSQQCAVALLQFAVDGEPVRLPCAHMVCNQTPPIGEGPVRSTLVFSTSSGVLQSTAASSSALLCPGYQPQFKMQGFHSADGVLPKDHPPIRPNSRVAPDKFLNLQLFCDSQLVKGIDSMAVDESGTITGLGTLESLSAAHEASGQLHDVTGQAIVTVAAAKHILPSGIVLPETLKLAESFDVGKQATFVALAVTRALDKSCSEGVLLRAAQAVAPDAESESVEGEETVLMCGTAEAVYTAGKLTWKRH